MLKGMSSHLGQEVQPGFISRLQRKSSKKSRCFSFLDQNHQNIVTSLIWLIFTPDLILVTKISKTKCWWDVAVRPAVLTDATTLTR